MQGNIEDAGDTGEAVLHPVPVARTPYVRYFAASNMQQLQGVWNAYAGSSRHSGRETTYHASIDSTSTNIMHTEDGWYLAAHPGEHTFVL